MRNGRLRETENIACAHRNRQAEDSIAFCHKKLQLSINSITHTIAMTKLGDVVARSPSGEIFSPVRRSLGLFPHRENPMTFSLLFLVLATLLLAYSIGSNDNFKGVATLCGSNVPSFRNALGLATFATFCGSISAIFIANELIASFSGKGLVPDDMAGTTEFLTAVSVGAGVTVLAASRAGIPISTISTHVSA